MKPGASSLSAPSSRFSAKRLTSSLSIRRHRAQSAPGVAAATRSRCGCMPAGSPPGRPLSPGTVLSCRRNGTKWRQCSSRGLDDPADTHRIVGVVAKCREGGLQDAPARRGPCSGLWVLPWKTPMMLAFRGLYFKQTINSNVCLISLSKSRARVCCSLCLATLGAIAYWPTADGPCRRFETRSTCNDKLNPYQ